MKIEKKYIVAGAIGVVTLTGAALYLQYRRLMDYSASVKNIKVNSFQQNNVDIDLILSLLYKANISFEILEQTYVVYINNKPVTTVTGKKQIKISKGENDIPVNIKFDPEASLKSLGGTSGILGMLTNINKIRLKVEIRLKVRLFGLIPVSIPYTMEKTVQELMQKKTN